MNDWVNFNNGEKINKYAKYGKQTFKTEKA